MKEYDVLVLGGGPGGYVAAIKGAQMGLKTVLIEKEELGGVCLNWGCIPTKALLKSAKVYEETLHSEKYGIDIKNKAEVTINWGKMQERKNKVVKQLTGGVQTLLVKNGVDVVKGYGEVLDKNTVKVNEQLVKTKNLIIATGASPFIPEFEGLKDAMDAGIAITSKEILELKELPRRLVIMGGGVIAIEFAILYDALGVDVTMVLRSDRILGNIDREIRETMAGIMKNKGIHILYNRKVQKISGNRIILQREDTEEILEGDKILISIGSQPNVNSVIKLELAMNKKGIVTNEKLETNISNVYAIGDVNGKYNLAHVASAEGIIAVENILGKGSKINYDRVPSCIYGFPEIGIAGLTEEEARERGHDVILSTFPVSANGKALAEGESEGFVKIVADKKYGEVLGVHIIASHATDMIAEAVTTMELEGTVHELAKAIHPHPTLSEIMMEAAHGAIDKPIHIYSRNK